MRRKFLLAEQPWRVKWNFSDDNLFMGFRDRRKEEKWSEEKGQLGRRTKSTSANGWGMNQWLEDCHLACGVGKRPTFPEVPYLLS